MLRSFRLGNHRSFRDEQELLLMPALPGDRRQAVSVAAIYGANASGKSNLLDGLALVRRLVVGPRSQRPAERGLTRESAVQDSFRLDPAAGDKPSVFVTEVVADGVPHTYGIVLRGHEVEEEWLYSYPAKRKRVLFERVGAAIKIGSTVTDLRTKLGLLQELVRPDALLLSECDRLSLGPLMAAYRWFEQVLIGVDRSDPATAGTTSPEQRVAEYLAADSTRSRRVLSLLKAADVGITDIVVRPVPAGTLDDTRPGYELAFVHGYERELFGLADESAGTRNWLGLLPSVLDAVDGGKVLVVDELETSLHPALSAKLVGVFRDQSTNTTGAQLIFTTHDTTLLGTMLGEEILARDEVWFVDKTAEGASELYPLTDFKPRKGQNTERRYLAGAYGAIPVLGTFTGAQRQG